MFSQFWIPIKELEIKWKIRRINLQDKKSLSNLTFFRLQIDIKNLYFEERELFWNNVIDKNFSRKRTFFSKDPRKNNTAM